VQRLDDERKKVCLNDSSHQFSCASINSGTAKLLLFDQRRALGIIPDRRKSVSLARFRIHRNLLRRFLSVGLWIRGYRDDMLSGRQRRVVILINPENRDFDAVDGEVYRLVYSKGRGSVYDQAGVIIGLRLIRCACNK